MSGNTEKFIPIPLSEVEYLEMAIKALRMALRSMVFANGFHEYTSGYYAETYEETIKSLILGIKDYLNKYAEGGNR